MSLLSAIWERIPAIKLPVQLSYDAVASDQKRRRTIRPDVRSEDWELDSLGRKKLTASVHDVARNYVLAAWMISKHLNATTSFSFQSKTGYADFDTKLEKLVAEWSLPENFDIAGRHGRTSFIRACEVSRLFAGDAMVIKLGNGHVQGIEGDRVANPLSGWKSQQYKLSDFLHGIRITKAGRSLNYIINRRTSTGGLEFERVVSAAHVIHYADYHRLDQIRGVSQLAPAITALQDTYEGITYALAKAKVTQLFALAVTREAGEAIGEISGGVTAAGDEDKASYEVDFGKGPAVLYGDPGDKFDFLESKHPQAEFQGFTKMMIQLVMKALDLPYCFYDEANTNYSGARQALLAYGESTAHIKAMVRWLLDELLRWRIDIWILDGILKLPGGMRVSDLTWEWQERGAPWIDPLKEVLADVEAINMKINSRQRVVKRTLGIDYRDLLDEIEEEERELKRRVLLPEPPKLDKSALFELASTE